MKWTKRIIFLLFFSANTMAVAQQIQILNADMVRMDGERKRKICNGNIRALHNGMYIQCDSAIINDADNTLDGMGNVRIYQPDTFTLTGQRIFYNGKTKMARVSGDVVLKDHQMTLKCPFIDYDTQIKAGSFSAKGEIQNGNDVLVSKWGYYDSRTNMAFFRDSVWLHNPDYTMQSDTLQYHTLGKTAYFHGPTLISSEENRILCNKGYYQTEQNLASFYNRATLMGQTANISADSFFYNRNTGVGKAFYNIILHDTSEQLKVYGHKGVYYEKLKEARVYDLPLGEKCTEQDTMLIMADSFFYYGDSLMKQLIAYQNAQIFASDMQGRSDTLFYLMKDSIVELLGSPVMWNEKNQITGDTITMYMENQQIQVMKVRFKAFVATEHPHQKYDQVSGKEIHHFFGNNKLRKVKVLGNAESIYYSKDEETDAYIGVNRISSGLMDVYLDSNGIENIRFFSPSSPEGTMYPPLDIPEDQQLLQGFQWRGDEKTAKAEFLKRIHEEVELMNLPYYQKFFPNQLMADGQQKPMSNQREESHNQHTTPPTIQVYTDEF
jgi:lipopolysaccharide export system protein LptA